MSITRTQKSVLESIRAAYGAQGCLTDKQRLLSALEEKLDASGEDEVLFLRLSMALRAGVDEQFLAALRDGEQTETPELHSRVIGFIIGETGFSADIAEEVFESFCVLADIRRTGKATKPKKLAGKGRWLAVAAAVLAVVLVVPRLMQSSTPAKRPAQTAATAKATARPTAKATAKATAKSDPLGKYKTKGNIVTFGHYEQDGDLTNGEEPIEWIVLDYDAEKNWALLVSKYGLDVQKYGGVRDMWKGSSLRTWLNDDFFNAAFSVLEQEQIPEVDTSVGDIENWSITRDKVWILSEAEARKYIGDRETFRLECTQYAKKKGNSSYWYLRSCTASSGPRVAKMDGSELYFSNSCEFPCVVRPAIWVDLNDLTLIVGVG